MTNIYTRAEVSAMAEQQRQADETQALTDWNVKSAHLAIESAQGKLLQAQNAKADVVLDPRWPRWNSVQRASVQTEAWERCQDAENALKAAQQSYDVALSSHAKSLRQSQQQADEQAAKAKFDEEQARRAAMEEQQAKLNFQAAYLQSGGTNEQFSKAWPDMWARELARRTEQAVAIKANLRASGYQDI